MNNNVSVGGLLLLAFWVASCESENNAPRLLRVTSISPGMTLLGGTSLGDALGGLCLSCAMAILTCCSYV
ncbi:hypothetical protein [Hymenobacter sp. YC55]|uniref:hypothetical protein n=1 Tax=Hymenobacter sp. YC55 TaxID=3034019 RepID=UPI0023F698B5|nr:hypothetical protein [Hymenobacter sp. YC55]MDF7813889.1 hypothetical protein [Hymenobacter sp. YC55]